MARKVAVPITVAFFAAAVVSGFLWHRYRSNDQDPTSQIANEEKVQIQKFCAACHAFPEPDTFPKFWWSHVIKDMYGYYEKATDSSLPQAPDIRTAIQYYTLLAPDELPLRKLATDSDNVSQKFSFTGLKMPLNKYPTAVANLRFLTPKGANKPRLFISELGTGISVADSKATPNITKLFPLEDPPCKIELIDLDKDGKEDLLVAALGSYFPTEEKTGKVIWLKATANGYQSFELLKNVGRVTDVQAADFDGDGDLDLIVACFGWRKNGAILYLENQTTDWSKPIFEPTILDTRTGTINVPIVDINRDGKPDFLALISQEHETVVAYLGKGGSAFEKQTLFVANDPSWGSDNINLVDLDQDGDLDLLISNGDSLDYGLPKPYHGISWLENQGSFPFVLHRLTDLPGAHCAKAVDLDGDGDLDIVASAFVPALSFEEAQSKGMEPLIWLEQTSPKTYVRHSFNLPFPPMCPTLDVCDFDGDGRPDIAFGCFVVKGSENKFNPDFSVGLLLSKGK